jgi:hypothetical protein
MVLVCGVVSGRQGLALDSAVSMANSARRNLRLCRRRAGNLADDSEIERQPRQQPGDLRNDPGAGSRRGRPRATLQPTVPLFSEDLTDAGAVQWRVPARLAEPRSRSLRGTGGTLPHAQSLAKAAPGDEPGLRGQ